MGLPTDVPSDLNSALIGLLIYLSKNVLNILRSKLGAFFSVLLSHNPTLLPSTMGLKERQYDMIIALFKLGPGGNYWAKENRVKKHLDEHPNLGRLCTCNDHRCDESDSSSSLSPPPSSKPGTPTIIPTRQQTRSASARAAASHRPTSTNSTPRRSHVRASTSHDDDTPPPPRIIDVPRTTATKHTLVATPSTVATSSPCSSTPGLSRPLEGTSYPLQQSSSPVGVQKVVKKTVPPRVTPTSGNNRPSSEVIGQSAMEKAPAMRVVVRIPDLISDVAERRDTQAPTSSELGRPQLRKESLEDFSPHVSDKLKETEDSKGGILKGDDDESSGGKGKVKDPVRFPPEEITSEKAWEEETGYIVSHRLWESRFRAYVSDRKGKGVVRLDPDDIADREETVSTTDSEPREDEDEENNIWEALKPGVQEQLRNIDYETQEEFLKLWNEAAEAYEMNSYRETTEWIYRGVAIV